VREIRTLRAMRRELETELRRVLNGHEGGNPGHSQGVTCGQPRQFSTLRTSSKGWHVQWEVNPPREKSDSCSLSRTSGGNEAGEVD